MGPPRPCQPMQSQPLGIEPRSHGFAVVRCDVRPAKLTASQLLVRSWQWQQQHHAKGKEKVQSLSRVQLFATLWTTAQQAPPSMGFSRQECWSGLPFPSHAKEHWLERRHFRRLSRPAESEFQQEPQEIRVHITI